MLGKSSKSAHLPQFDATEPRQRIILLGASNLSISFPTIVEAARAMFGRPLEFFVAMGFGRSYGKETKFFGKKFSGILRSHLWASLDRAPPAPTVAIVADVGNDLAYEAPVATILEWINQTLDRLAATRASVALNNIPLGSLSGVGALRYYLMRSVLFPGCRLPREELLCRAGELSEALDRVAAEREIPAFSGESAWYGVDPIHPRRASAHEIWQRLLSALAPPGGDAVQQRLPRRDERQLRSLQRRAWLARDVDAPRPQATDRLPDGTTVALF